MPRAAFTIIFLGQEPETKGGTSWTRFRYAVQMPARRRVLVRFQRSVRSVPTDVHASETCWPKCLNSGGTTRPT